MANQDERKTVKQERAERRAEKVLAYQREQAAAKRRRRIGIISGAVGGGAVIALIVGFAIAAPKPTRPEDIQISGLQEFNGLPANHVDPNRVDYEAEYGMLPPAGGDHSQMWLNCGVYNEPQPNENAVHSLEHGAVWVTYDPAVTTGDDIAELRRALPDLHTILSPYPGLPAPIVASAWGAQIQLDTPSDERLGQFIDKYWRSLSAPEPGASCAGALEGPGRVA